MADTIAALQRELTRVQRQRLTVSQVIRKGVVCEDIIEQIIDTQNTPDGLRVFIRC